MKILIIEDEPAAASRLEKMILKQMPEAIIIDVIDSVQNAIKWFQSFDHPDLIFLDIQLADGLSFGIFEKVEVLKPIVFTTAFDKYLLKAFSVNSLDYLLKPIDQKALKIVFEKYEKLHFSPDNIVDMSTISALKAALIDKHYQERFLVKNGQQLNYIQANDIAYFYAEQGINFLRTKEGKRHMLDRKLDEIVDKVNPRSFFRINRGMIIHHSSISKISPYLNSRLKLGLEPKTGSEVIVSRERASEFKKWLDQ